MNGAEATREAFHLAHTVLNKEAQNEELPEDEILRAVFDAYFNVMSTAYVGDMEVERAIQVLGGWMLDARPSRT